MAGSSAAVMVVALLALAPADAVLPGSPSGFESNDGDMVGSADWAGVKNDTRYFSASDPTTSTDNSFEPGSKQDEACPDVAGHSNPPKDDFTDAASFVEVSGSGTVFLYGATIRSAANGNASENIELKQGLNGYCPDGGATPTTSPLLRRSAGDKMIAIDYLNGGTGVTFNVLTWVTSGACYIASHVPPCFGATVQTLGANGAEGKVNQADITAANNSISGKAIKAGQFAEFGVNLQAAGIIPAGTCKAFPQMIWESRAAGSSFVSSTKDIIIENKTISNCGSIKIRKVTENGDDTFGYTTTGTGLSSFNLGNGGLKEFSDVQTGSYSVTEVLTAGQLADGWSLKDLQCTVSGSGTSATPAAASVAITMGPGGSVDCTFTNFRKFSPSITTKLNNDSASISVPVGSSVFDTAVLTGASSNAGGTVTYTAYSNNTCTVAVPSSSSVKNVTNGTVPQSDSVTFNTAGTFYWQAVYSGDVNNFGATSACTDEVLTVTKRQPSATTAQNLKPNDSFTLVNGFGTPGGSVTFNLYSPSDATCAGTPALTETVALSGAAAATSNTTFIASAEGTWRWEVIYTGDTNNHGVTLACGHEAFTIDNDTTS